MDTLDKEGACECGSKHLLANSSRKLTSINYEACRSGTQADRTQS